MVVYDYQGCADEKSSVCPLMTMAMIMYNRREYVLPAVESLLKQDYPNLEIVISDDHSEDGALETVLEIVRRYRGPHRVVVNVNERNLGLGGNFSVALSLSNGEWVIACGGDDIQHVNRVGRIADYARLFPTAVVIGSGADTIDQNGNRVGHMGVEAPYLYKKYHNGELKIGAANTVDRSATLVVVAGACAAYRKDLCDACAFPAQAFFEDLVMDLRAIRFGDILLVPERLVDYRVHPQSVCTGGGKAVKRSERRKFRRKISGYSYVSFKCALSESLFLGKSDGGEFPDFLEKETAKSLLWSFYEPCAFPWKSDLYVNAYKTARKKYSFFDLLRGAEGRGVLVKFITVAFLAGIYRKPLRLFKDLLRDQK